jgi:hypothetical protein
MRQIPSSLSMVFTGSAEEFANTIMQTSAPLPAVQREAIINAYVDAFLRRMALLVGTDAARLIAMAALGAYPVPQSEPAGSRQSASVLALVKTNGDAKQ